MAKVSLDTVRSLLRYLIQQGLSEQQLLKQLNINYLKLQQSRQLVDSDIYQKLFRFGEKLLSDPLLGFHFGQQIEADRWGILGYIAYTSKCLFDAAEKQKRYQSIVGNIGTPIVETNSELVTFKWVPFKPLTYHVVEEVITGWVALARKLSLQPISPKQVTFTHSCHGSVNQYVDYFDCPVFFEQPINSLTIEQQVLKLPLSRHDPELNNLLSNHAETILNHMVKKLPLQVLSDFLQQQLPVAVPEIASAAQHLNSSVRTLQRKLKQQGLTYTQLIDQVRLANAKSYLSDTQLDLNQIAQLLGFSEQSAFQRAFKRWTGITPNQHRSKKND